MSDKFPNCAKQGFIIERNGVLSLNEARFFMSLTYNDFRRFEDQPYCTYKSKWNVPGEQKLEEVERFLSEKWVNQEEYD